MSGILGVSSNCQLPVCCTSIADLERVGMPFDDGGIVFRFTKSNAEGNKSFSTLRATLYNKFMIPPCP